MGADVDEAGMTVKVDEIGRVPLQQIVSSQLRARTFQEYVPVVVGIISRCQRGSDSQEEVISPEGPVNSTRNSVAPPGFLQDKLKDSPSAKKAPYFGAIRFDTGFGGSERLRTISDDIVFAPIRLSSKLMSLVLKVSPLPLNVMSV